MLNCMAAYEPRGETWNVMLYAGFSQSWFCRPAAMLRFNSFQGILARTIRLDRSGVRQIHDPLHR